MDMMSKIASLTANTLARAFAGVEGLPDADALRGLL